MIQDKHALAANTAARTQQPCSSNFSLPLLATPRHCKQRARVSNLNQMASWLNPVVLRTMSTSCRVSNLLEVNSQVRSCKIVCVAIWFEALSKCREWNTYISHENIWMKILVERPYAVVSRRKTTLRKAKKFGWSGFGFPTVRILILRTPGPTGRP